MAFPQVALALGFFFVFSWTQAATAIRDSKYPVPSEDNPRHIKISIPAESQHASASDSSSTSSDESSDGISKNDIGKQGFSNADLAFTNRDVSESKNKETRYPYSTVSSHVSTVQDTDTPSTSYPYTFKRDTGRPPDYTGRHTNSVKDTAYPYTSPKSATASPTVYTGRYTTAVRDTAHPYTSPKPDTANPTVYTGRYTTGYNDITTRYICSTRGYYRTTPTPKPSTPKPSTPKPSTPEPWTPVRQRTDDYFTTTTIGYICDTRPYDPTDDPTPTPYKSTYYRTPKITGSRSFTTRTTGNTRKSTSPGRLWFTTPATTMGYICNTRPDDPTYDPTPTPYDTTYYRTRKTTSPGTPRFTPTPTTIGYICNTRPYRDYSPTWKTEGPGTTPRPRPTPSWWWITSPRTSSTPKTKQITKSKPNSGSDLVPGSLKNYFFIACESCNVFSKIDVKKDTGNPTNSDGGVMFQSMIDNMETKIDAALQNIMAT